MVKVYPLYWPEGWKKTAKYNRKQSKFKTGFATARDFLIAEIKRLGGTQIVLSTNVRLRGDGLPYASEREPEDSGAAVYFTYKKQQMCFACDQYRRVQENLTAIGKTIEAIRGMERWGASDMMERAFSGFKALEAGKSWRQVMGFEDRELVSAAMLDMQFKNLAIKHHPDRGGDVEKFKELVQAREDARRELGA